MSLDAANLQQQLKIQPVFCQLLVQRGIKTFEEAKTFFRPSLEHLHDPFLMKDMDRAVERIDKAIAQKEKILVYGDYDVDGTTSVALVYSFFKNHYKWIDYYIPNRYTEGYGISTQGIDYAKEHGYTLIIALDCGIKSVDKVDYAKKLGVDFIICDHHLPDEQIPKAIAVLDPKRPDCKYPYKELSGCGIGFKLIQAWSKLHVITMEELRHYLDLVVVSIASDIVPITGENRVMAHFGLQIINHNPRPGLQALINLSGVKRDLNISDIVFVIGPRINAAGRMDDAKEAVKLLVSEHADHAFDNAEELNKKNFERREHDKGITEEALEMLRSNEEEISKKTTVLFRPHWHKGVIGIVASRLIEQYYRPTIILTESQGVISGSARSVPGFDIYSAIQKCSDLLDQFGGHMFAAGLTMKPENVDAFKAKFEKVVSESIDETLLVPEISIDAELELEDITENFYNILKQFAPFGPANMKPVFVTRNVIDKGARIVGDDHIKFKFGLKNKKEAFISGIGFGMASKFDHIEDNVFDVCYTVEENEWRGNKSIELLVKEVK